MNELYIGTGKPFAQVLVNHRRQLGHRVYCISSTDGEDTFVVDWSTVTSADLHKIINKLPKLDVILFNQNASSLSQSCFQDHRYSVLQVWQQTKHWQQSYYVSCQLPFELIHSLGNKINCNSLIIWTLSSMITDHTHDPQYADYIAYKYQNYMLMKNFAHSHTGCFFGIDPGQITKGLIPDSQFVTKAVQFDQLLKQPNLNGKVWVLDGTVSKTTELFG